MRFLCSLTLSEIEVISIMIMIINFNFPVATLFVFIHFLTMALISVICCLNPSLLENNLLVLCSDVLQVEYGSLLAQHRLSRL